MLSNDSSDNELSDLLRQVERAFGFGALTGHVHAGGTAGARVAATESSSSARYMIRLRPREVCRDSAMLFEHEALRAYQRAGLPAPSARRTVDGQAWLDTDRGRVEVFDWLEGEPFRPHSLPQIRSLATFAARFHAAGQAIQHDGKGGVRREDHPDELAPYLQRLHALSPSMEQTRKLDAIGDELSRLRRELSDERCAALPQAIIHGDLHPGNVAFCGEELCAVYDFDYLSRQPRVRDLTDGIILFCSRRATELDTGSIRSLTQPFEPVEAESRVWLTTYAAHASPTLMDDEWAAMPLFIRSRWLQMRLRGSRKIAEGERLNYVLDRIEAPLEWLTSNGAQFFANLHTAMSVT